MNIAHLTPEQLVAIVNGHLNCDFIYKDCLEIVENMKAREAQGILTDNNRALIAKLEAQP
jgi:hypothetical protein